ncbi:MAG: Shedu anti-phage system protein SduA domain-containing protein [Cyanobacteria bacterium J06621_8]
MLKEYFNFGHHGAYLFREFQLGNSYKVDYLLIGKNSGGWHFVFVELEAVQGRITKEDGSLGEVFRMGLEQVSDWNRWLEAKYSALRETFDKYKKLDSSLPDEFTQLDTTRIHYVVVAGRRKDFKERTYRIRRENQKRSSGLLLHYDNLIDTAENIIGKSTY